MPTAVAFIRAIFMLMIVALSPELARAEKPPALRIAMFSGSKEYASNESLEKLKKLLEEKLGATCTLSVVEEKGKTLAGSENLETADLAIIFTRRVALSDEELAKVKKFVKSGRGIVGIRTASHAFQTWLEFDHEILGGSYNNHYGKELPAQVSLMEKAKDHPVLLNVKPFATNGKLYKNPTLAEDVTLLLNVKTADYQEPAAWVREAKMGAHGRVFYTSLGVQKDFDDPNFQTLLVNAVAWVAAREPL